MMMKYFLGPVAALMLLVGCGDASNTSNSADAGEPPSPALWLVANEAGETEGWLFGTIHALPDGVEWRTEALDKALRQSEAMAVEIADLDDQGAIARTFYQLALSPGRTNLIERVSVDRQEALEALMTEGDFSKGEFKSTDTWAAAITLAQLASVGDTDNGVDRALVRGFGGRPIIELEGVAKQLGIFDALPENEQIDLLHAVIDEGTDLDADEPAQLMITWRSGNLEQLEQETSSGMLADSELRETLLIDRNEDWAKQLQALFPNQGPIMVAVGAAHMVGPDGLPNLLSDNGYAVTRIQ